ncbi:hypothetical protein DICPUDRAFT_84186 [Dictyostelium purpureum]|uniref:Cell division topological specificity factor MinE n=1 Tax=Dictyostelium purpureum TaxID=5786 RepID=F1A1U6_DICPU|nr:uncharacterized protein DICPUDRAFT_84186 [Dictyostelium purpureum]EGC29839.1 hypothetical protein DICPUDRAFT_84186 [Dictyostelium purpureum]|eukprot:XP_003293637.1 hypothetical protein DICPUDRAFT_84186 [Dictyostelium purpureum]
MSKIFNLKQLANIFKVKESQLSANVASQRMQIFLKEQRGARSIKDDNISKIKSEVLEVVAKYWQVSINDVSFSIKKSTEEDKLDLDIFEMQITMPKNDQASPSNKF